MIEELHGWRGVAQPGSAPEWGSGGRRFKSSRPDQNSGDVGGLAKQLSRPLLLFHFLVSIGAIFLLTQGTRDDKPTMNKVTKEWLWLLYGCIGSCLSWVVLVVCGVHPRQSLPLGIYVILFPIVFVYFIRLAIWTIKRLTRK